VEATAGAPPPQGRYWTTIASRLAALQHCRYDDFVVVGVYWGWASCQLCGHIPIREIWLIAPVHNTPPGAGAPGAVHRVPALYQLLGLTEIVQAVGAEAVTPEQIKAGYRQVAKAVFPRQDRDRYPGGPAAWEQANAEMAEINRAYEVLANPDKREQYHRLERLAEAAAQQAQAGGMGRQGATVQIGNVCVINFVSAPMRAAWRAKLAYLRKQRRDARKAASQAANPNSPAWVQLALPFPTQG